MNYKFKKGKRDYREKKSGYLNFLKFKKPPFFLQSKPYIKIFN